MFKGTFVEGWAPGNRMKLADMRTRLRRERERSFRVIVTQGKIGLKRAAIGYCVTESSKWPGATGWWGRSSLMHPAVREGARLGLARSLSRIGLFGHPLLGALR